MPNVGLGGPIRDGDVTGFSDFANRLIGKRLGLRRTARAPRQPGQRRMPNKMRKMRRWRQTCSESTCIT